MPSVSVDEACLAKKLAQRYGETVSASCRLKKEDVDLAKNLGLSRITIFTPVSNLHLKYKLRLAPEENLKRGVELVDYALKNGLKVDFAFEDATRADEDYLLSYIRALEDKIAVAFLADTVGYLIPEKSYDFFRRIKSLTKTKLGVHAHDDFGLATANTLAALRGGAEVFSGTFGGIGERAGNAPIEEVCCAMRYLYGEALPVRFEMLADISKRIQKYAGVTLQPNKAIIGKNAFCHESGIHADGIIKCARTYEALDPKDVGMERTFHFGKTSGKGLLRYVLGKTEITENDMLRLLEEVKTVSQSSKVTLNQSDLLKLHEAVEEEALSYSRFNESLEEFEKRNRMIVKFTKACETDPKLKGLILVGSMAHSPDKVTRESDLDYVLIYADRADIVKKFWDKKMRETAKDMESCIVDVIRYSEMVDGIESVQHIMPLDIFIKICNSTILYLNELRDIPKAKAHIPTFGGAEQEIDMHMIRKNEGYLIRVPVSLEIGGKYYGGPHQDMFLANPKILLELDALIRDSIDKLWCRIVERHWKEHKQQISMIFLRNSNVISHFRMKQRNSCIKGISMLFAKSW